ncbi:sialidase-1-like [Amphiura filiformis]|uniref:sialidase-1-like n=1 Tax=Amphiura filiformis TaxID=82378 RepID=UPI003B215A80
MEVFAGKNTIPIAVFCNLCMVVSYLHLFLTSVLCLNVQPIVWEEQILWASNASGEVDTFRIPMIINASNGDLLAFAEARKFSAGDTGAKFLAMRRSTDQGSSWKPTQFIVDDYVVQDGLNLGAVLYDYEAATLILLYQYCGHDTNSSKCVLVDKGEQGVYVMSSKDNGYTWTKPFNLGQTNPELINYHWAPGPGQGIQKMLAPNKGRLISCGHMNTDEDHSMVCLYSDDHGFTWHIGGTIVGLPQGVTKNIGDLAPGETQVVELPDGSVYIAVRNTHWFHCHCRIHAYSYDGAETFKPEDLFLDEVLLDPNVCGAMILHGGNLYFANAFHIDKRVNMTVRWSLDLGDTWPGTLPIYPGSSAYPCLTSIDYNHIGLVYEKNDYKEISFVKIRLNP